MVNSFWECNVILLLLLAGICSDSFLVSDPNTCNGEFRVSQQCHLLCKNLISRILKNFYLLWKRIAKERKFLISSSCPGDDGEPKYFIPSEG